MKAAVYSQYGGPEVVRVADIDVPVPADDEILVKVHAAALNPLDWHLTRGTPFPLRAMDWVWRAEETAAARRRLRRGRRVSRPQCQGAARGRRGVRRCDAVRVDRRIRRDPG